MAEVAIRPFHVSDGNCVQMRLRSAWRLEIPKQFNLTQVIAEQPAGHAIVVACVAVLYAIMGDIGMLCMAIPGFYIALYFVVLMVFLLKADELLLRELEDIPNSYQNVENSQFWVAESNAEEKEIVGTVGLLRKSDSLAEIRHLMVEDGQEKKSHITKSLLHTSIKFARDNNYTDIEILISAIREEHTKVFTDVGLKLKTTFYLPSKHLYILPMQILHVKVEDLNMELITDGSKLN